MKTEPVLIKKENPRICYYNVIVEDLRLHDDILKFKDLSNEDADKKVAELKAEYVNHQYCEFHY